MTEKYNGYTNWETWCVSLWFDNTLGVYEQFRGEVERMRDEGKGDRAITLILAQQAEGRVGDGLYLFGEIFGTNQYNLSLVDWEEVAASFVEG